MAVSALERRFEASLASIDNRQLEKNLIDLRGAVKRLAAAWHVVEPAIARLKLDNAIHPSEESVLLPILRHAASESRASLKAVRRTISNTLKPSGIIDVVASGAPSFAPKVRINSLPPIDAAELRALGLTDVEILRILRAGIHEYRTNIARTRKVDLSERLFGRIDTRLKAIEKSNQKKWLYRACARNLRGCRRSAGSTDGNRCPRQALVHRRNAGRHCGPCLLDDERRNKKNDSAGSLIEKRRSLGSRAFVCSALRSNAACVTAAVRP